MPAHYPGPNCNPPIPSRGIFGAIAVLGKILDLSQDDTRKDAKRRITDMIQE